VVDLDELKEEMIDTFEELYANAKMEVLSGDSDAATIRQLFGQIQGFFIAMKMSVPMDMEEVVYVEDRLRRLEERIPAA
jgi:hypothetical protein